MSADTKCPLCGHIFDSKETFGWAPDMDGHPTVESISCPKCFVGTEPRMSCDWCPVGSAGKCDREEECPCCVSFSFDQFEEIITPENAEPTQQQLTHKDSPC